MTSSFVGNTQAFQAQVAAPRTSHVRTSTLIRTHHEVDGLHHACLTVTMDNHNAIENIGVVIAGQNGHGYA